MADFTPTWTDWTDPGPFRFWAQKVLPLVYDDSLSYYEVLCKVVAYLNTTIQNVAALGGNVEGLRDAYEQLQQYVNDYFDNLDVQQEINTKLDEMAETGALTTLIEPFINAQISTDVFRWLDLNIKPTTPAIDASLTVSGAGADAKVTGERIGDVTNTFLQFTGASDVLDIAKYEKGSLTTSTGANSDFRANARARTIANTIAPFDFTLEPINEETTDFYVRAVFYNADGTFKAQSDEIHAGASLEISRGQIYRLLIGDTTRQAASSVISLEELISHIKFASVFGEESENIGKIGEIESSLNTDTLHFAISSKTATWLTENQDISLLAPGNYICMSTAVAETLAGLPVTMNKATFRLMVIGNPSDIKTFILIPRFGNEIFIRKNINPWFSIGTPNDYAFVSASSGSDDNRGIATSPFKTIGFALQNGFRKIKVEPGVYNEKISLNSGLLEIIPWVDNQAYSAANAPFRPKIELIKGTKLTISAAGATGIYQANFTAAANSKIYKIFVDHSLAPTTAGSLALEYNALLIGDNPNTSTASKPFSPYRQRLYTPVLTENELSAEGTFWYNGTNLIKFHPWNNTADGAYYIPDDDADTGISLAKMDSVHIEDVKVLGCYNNCIYINKSDNVVLNACEAGYCAKGMGIKLDYTNAKVSDCHAYGISADGFNFHGYGQSEIISCSAYYCGDDGISHHEGCSGFIDGGEWAYNGSGGITPAFGAQVNVKNAYCHHNKRGIQWLGQSTTVRETIMSNCLSIDNSEYDITNEFYVVNAYNCVCRTIYDRYNSDRSKLRQYNFTILET